MNASARASIVKVVLALTLLAGCVATATADDGPAGAPDPLISIHDGFVDERTCASCHADQAAAFATSHHARAMAVADEASIRADFGGERFSHHGVDTSFFKRDDRFMVRTEGPDGKEGDFEVKYSFAWEPLQQYLIDIGGGRLQALDIAWDTQKRQWFWLGEGSAARPGSTFHWTGPFYRWNANCIDCHSTDPKANFQPATGTYQSSYVATSIGCQSCHGGGARHVAWAEGKAGADSSDADTGFAPVAAETCFGCHSRRTRLVADAAPGRPFLDQYTPAMMRADLYFPDGQIMEEVFEYGSFQQSKMAGAGVTCLDCHRPHEATLKAAGNAVCTQCHAETRPERFADFRPEGAFDTPAHTHHREGSDGALCANCHMPERTYMKVDPRRDHSFVIPRPDLSAAYGTPNACTTCHEGRTNAWAADTMDAWYGKGWRERPSVAHAFASAARGDPAAIEALRAVVADPARSGFVRGSAVAEIGRLGGAGVTAEVKAAAADRDPLVRLGAAEAAQNLPPEARPDAVGALLRDPVRAVRVSAVTALGGVPADELLGNARRDFDSAVADLRAYVEANADSAEVQNSYGLFLLGQRRIGEAEEVLNRSIALNPTFAGARVNLAELYRVAGDGQKSEKTYAEAVALMPEDPSLRYGHGLALVRTQAIGPALAEFEAAVRLDPANDRYKTTFAIALDSVGRTSDAFAMLRKAAAAGAASGELLGTAIQFGLKLRLYPETLVLAEKLAAAQPGNGQLAQLVMQLRAATGQQK